MAGAPVPVSSAQARRIWLHAQRLDVPEPFGAGPEATPRAVAHLGYVQIDTINVIERCHHHILHTRIPGYRREHLRQAQSVDKSVFEYWTHALAYLPTADLRFCIRAMNRHRRRRSAWFASVRSADLRKVLALVRHTGALTIRDIDDDVLTGKDHAWASRKPSRRALQLAFFRGIVTVSARAGMLKTYDLATRHFGWERPPRAATEREILDHLLDRALRSQGLVSVDSACHLDNPRKPAMHRLMERRTRRKELVRVAIAGADGPELWARPEALETAHEPAALVHILSPFDPLCLQRRRLQRFFGYQHVFEAYLPKAKRRFGYFALPVLAGEDIVAVLDLKTDRERGRLLMQQWTWTGPGTPRLHKRAIDEALHRFERFQLGR